MIINDEMVGVLYKIRCNESMEVRRDLNVRGNELANRLIHLYYQTDNINSHELIIEFMTQAGVVWLRKLLTKDTSPITSSDSELASLGDYIGLLVDNDISADRSARHG